MKLQASMFLKHPTVQFVVMNLIVIVATEAAGYASKRIWILKNNKPAFEAEEVEVEEV